MWLVNILTTEEYMFIAYDIKNGIEYGKICISKRVGNKTSKSYINLGRVIDKDNLIFKNRKQGVFKYNLTDNTYSAPDASLILPEPASCNKEKLIVDFGDSYILDSFIRNEGISDIIDSIEYGNSDTTFAMVQYYILCSMANCHALTWWEGNFARYLYPKANLVSQRISEFLATIGSEECYRNFFEAYIPFISGMTANGDNILIDSTGLPNSIHFPLTAISNHNGDINNEVRLIYVSQQETGYPIYMRYCPGNVIDVSTLVRTIYELKEAGVNTKFAILDAGYYDENSIRTLYEEKVSFISRLKTNRKLYKKLVSENLGSIQEAENLVEYNGRYAYIKCVQCEIIEGHQAYAYVGLDISRKNTETQKLFKKAKAEKMSVEEVHEKMLSEGAFVLVSSRRIAKDKILPNYYTRQQIEQIFDIGKNYADMLPLRVQGEDTFRGHLLLTFIATVIIKRLQDKLKDSNYNPLSMFLAMRNQKCKVYDDKVITSEAFKKANDCYKLLGIKCPEQVPLIHIDD